MLRLFALLMTILCVPMSAFASLTYVQHSKDGMSETRWTVSSKLPAQGGHDFGPRNFADGHDAWCEAAPGRGVGQWVQMTFSENRTFSSVNIVNGYAKSKRTFRENSRARRVMLRLSNGKTFFFKLKDTLKPQTINFPNPQTAAWIKLTILSIFPGKEFQDTCITKFAINGNKTED